VADGSFGVQVAKLAQLPDAIITRAQELVEHFDSGQPLTVEPAQVLTMSSDAVMQGLRQENDQLRVQISQLKQVAGELQALDYDDISPKKALDILWKMKGLV
jgi:DNA mismatch repair protein MutS